MKRIFITSVVLLLALSTLFSACKKKEIIDNNDQFDRKALLTNYADNYVIPAYQDMVQKMNELKASTDQFTANPTEANLATLQTGWKKAYITWQNTELLEFGPAEDVSLRMFINIYPASASKVNTNISSGTYDLNAFGNKDAQGFPALDLLLNGLGVTNAEIVSFYTTDSEAPNRKKYLQDVVNHMQTMIADVSSKWTTYRSEFIASTGTDVNSSLSEMVNSYVLYYERYFRSGKIGLPVGAMSGVAAPELTEAYYSPSLSPELARTSMQAIRNFYEGSSYNGTLNGAGLRDYMRAIGTMDGEDYVSDIIASEMDEVITSLSTLGPIKDAVVNNRPGLLTLYDKVQEIVPLLKVDMVSALGISISYVDNDGD